MECKEGKRQRERGRERESTWFRRGAFGGFQFRHTQGNVKPSTPRKGPIRRTAARREGSASSQGVTSSPYTPSKQARERERCALARGGFSWTAVSSSPGREREREETESTCGDNLQL